jgi:hypothetical protein
MTEQERDAAVLGANGAVDDETVDDAALAEGALGDEDEQGDAEDAGATGAAVAGSGAGAAVAAAGAGAGAAAGGRRNRGAPKAAPAAPSVSEQAVRVDDRASAWFVIGLVALFAIVFANALLLGQGGLVSNLFPTPTPIVTPAPTAKPTAIPTAAPSASSSASPAASASPAPTVAPTAAPTPAAKPTPTAKPS